jgi:hypothetical protein
MLHMEYNRGPDVSSVCTKGIHLQDLRMRVESVKN